MNASQKPSQELVEQFVLAAHGNYAGVKELHEQHPELLNVPWAKFDETALQAASHMGNRQIAEYLLAAGAPLNTCAAAMLGMTEQVAQFLDDDPGLANAKGAHGIPVLYHAAMSGNTKIAGLLLAHGGGEGTNGALHGAIRFGHLKMVEWLLDHGVTNPNIPDFNNNTPLAAAIGGNHTEIADLLRRHGGVEQTA